MGPSCFRSAAALGAVVWGPLEVELLASLLPGITVIVPRAPLRPEVPVVVPPAALRPGVPVVVPQASPQTWVPVVHCRSLRSPDRLLLPGCPCPVVSRVLTVAGVPE